MLRSIFSWVVPTTYTLCAALELFVFIRDIHKWYAFVFMLFTVMFIFFLWTWYETNIKKS